MIPATQETEAGGSQILGQPEKFSKTMSQEIFFYYMHRKFKSGKLWGIG